MSHWFAYIEESWHWWKKPNLIMVYELFDVVLNSLSENFVEDFCIYVHQWYWLLIFFLYGIFLWFWYQIIFKVCRWPYVVHSMDLEKCIHCYTVIQSIFSAPRSSVFYLSFPLPTPVPSIHWYSYCLYTFVFSRMSYPWNHIVCSFLRLASFSQ